MIARRKGRIDASIDLTPLIDVVFQLLIFLMVASNFAKREALVDLPTAPGDAPPAAREVETLSLTINPDNTILLDAKPLEIDALGDTIRSKVDATGITRAEIRGDRNSDLGTFVLVMETIRANGIESVGLVKERDDDPDSL